VAPDDRRLIAECLAGHSAAFGDLVRRYQDRLFHSVLRLVDQPADAADVVQDAFLNAYQNLESFKGDAEFFTWLYRVAFNAAISRRRRTKPLASLEIGPSGELFEPADDSEGIRPGELLERGEDYAAVHAGLKRLSPEHRAVLVLKDIDGLKYEEIAEITGVPIGTVRSRLHRARLELRTLLAPDEIPGAASEEALKDED
jgi:RNA polymerase sigma-70 factor, ECF subfamily